MERKVILQHNELTPSPVFSIRSCFLSFQGIYSQKTLRKTPFIHFETFPRLWIQFSWHDRPIHDGGNDFIS